MDEQFLADYGSFLIFQHHELVKPESHVVAKLELLLRLRNCAEESASFAQNSRSNALSGGAVATAAAVLPSITTPCTASCPTRSGVVVGSSPAAAFAASSCACFTDQEA